MTTVHTQKILKKLEQVVRFSLGNQIKYNHVIELYPDNLGNQGAGPATDGKKIFLLRRENKFKTEKDNELYLANITAHEADHIVECYEYFGTEMESILLSNKTPVKIYLEQNYSHLTENPALAGWIDNVVKDRRIDQNRRNKLKGVNTFFTEKLNPISLYLRPSIKNMSELDAFRELYLQKALLGKTNETVPDNKKDLLEKIIQLTNSSDSIFKDKETTEQIYNLFKENFDITRPISRMPPLPGSGNSSSKNCQSPQSGYGKQIKEREDRSPDDKKPEHLADPSTNSGDKEKDSKKTGNQDDGKDNSDDKGKDKDTSKNKKLISKNRTEMSEDRKNLYKAAKAETGTSVIFAQPNNSEDGKNYTYILKGKYSGEIESMKRVFRQLQLRNYGDKQDFSGETLDFDSYLQDDLQSRVTGIKGIGRNFISSKINTLRPTWAVLADISPSTDPENYNIIEPIKAGLLVQGEALSVTDYPFGLYAFSINLVVIKDFHEKYTPDTANKIANVNRSGNGTNLGENLDIVGKIISYQNESPKGITIITDGESSNPDYAKATINKLSKRKIHPFLIVIGRKFENYAKFLTEDIGDEHYSIIEKEEIHRLPSEMFRMFKTYGIAK